MLPPDDRFKLVDYERERPFNGVPCVIFVMCALVLAMLLTLTLYAFEILS